MLEIRPARPEDARYIARVHVETWRTTYAGLVPREFLDGLSREKSARGWRDVLRRENSGVSVLVAGDSAAGVVGFAGGGPLRKEVEGHPRYKGEVYALYVLREYQGRGVGARLLEEMFRRLATRRLAPVALWVVARNPACGFYEALGGVRIGERTENIGGVNLLIAAYGWPRGRVRRAP